MGGDGRVEDKIYYYYTAESTQLAAPDTILPHLSAIALD
jgi:hypothetical protein